MSRITSIFDRDVDPVTSPLVGFKVIGPNTPMRMPEREDEEEKEEKEITMEEIQGRMQSLEDQVGMIGDMLLSNTGFAEEQEEFMAGTLFSKRDRGD